jgi:hypothetical protein
MAKADEESADSFHHCVERAFLFDCAYFCLECSPLGWLSVLEPTLSGFRVHQDLSYLFEASGLCFTGGGNTTETVVSTSTGAPLTNVGLYRHCNTALTAESLRLVGPETYRALFTAPF